MEMIAGFKVKQIFNFDPLLWLWLLLGVIGVIGLGILISWFFGKPVVKFYINNKVESIVPCKRNEKLQIPLELSEYVWYEDKKLTKSVDTTQLIKRRVLCLYTSTEKIVEGVK